MIVVSDASAIINLAAIDQVDVLGHLYERVLIPAAVFDEIVLAGDGRHFPLDPTTVFQGRT